MGGTTFGGESLFGRRFSPSDVTVFVPTGGMRLHSQNYRALPRAGVVVWSFVSPSALAVPLSRWFRFALSLDRARCGPCFGCGGSVYASFWPAFVVVLQTSRPFWPFCVCGCFVSFAPWFGA